jgi:hypothetical protein
MNTHISRRAWLDVSLAIASTSQARATETVAATSLGNGTHFLARPEFRDALVTCFSEVLGCGAPMTLPNRDPAGPVLAFKFPGGGSVSVQFTAEALDETLARRGAWLDLKCRDPAALEAAVLKAGLPQIHYPATTTFYFAAPGGQVFGVARTDRPELAS